MVAGYDASDALISVYSIGTGEPLAPGATTAFTRQLHDDNPPPARIEAYASATVSP
jgi:hypothetical protein